MNHTRWRASLALLCVSTALAGALCGQTNSTADVGLRPTYTFGDVNTTASRVYTHVFKKTSLGHEHAIEGAVKYGRLRLDAQRQAGEIVFDLRSFDADTDAARKFLGLAGTTGASMRSQVNDNMRGAAVLDVAKYPTAVYAIASATQHMETSNSNSKCKMSAKVFCAPLWARTTTIAIGSGTRASKSAKHVTGPKTCCELGRFAAGEWLAPACIGSLLGLIRKRSFFSSDSTRSSARIGRARCSVRDTRSRRTSCWMDAVRRHDSCRSIRDGVSPSPTD